MTIFAQLKCFSAILAPNVLSERWQLQRGKRSGIGRSSENRITLTAQAPWSQKKVYIGSFKLVGDVVA
jgi:hypothetical protein